MSKDSHVTAQNAHSFPVREGEKFRFFIELENFNFSTLFSDFSSRGSLLVLLHLIFITFVVCIAEIAEFHTFFLCFSRTFENFSLVSFGACDKFSLPSVVVSLSMSQTRGSCGHLKGSYDNHRSCLNCSGCFRSSCCSVCQLWPDSTWSLVAKRRRFSDRRKMGKTKEEKAKSRKGKDSASRNSSSSRRGLEQTVARADPSGSTADGHDDDNASVLSLSSSGVSGYAGTLGFLAVEAHTEHRVLVRRDGGPNVPPLPDPILAIWLVSMGFRLRPRTLRLRFLVRTPHRATLTR